MILLYCVSLSTTLEAFEIMVAQVVGNSKQILVLVSVSRSSLYEILHKFVVYAESINSMLIKMRASGFGFDCSVL